MEDYVKIGAKPLNDSVLSRAEMKMIIGGVEAVNCSTSACKLFVASDHPQAPGGYVEHDGQCDKSGSVCFCNIYESDEVFDLASNGGVSRCTLS